MRPSAVRASLVAIAVVCACLDVTPRSAAQTPAATLIRGASIVDGSGAPRRAGDVRIVGDRVTEVGQLTASASDTIVDARGLVLAPGFIDTHSHHDRGLVNGRDALAMVSQGVTTIVVGQDGGGSSLQALFARLESEPAAVNVASYAGHGSIRRAVLGDDFKRHATAGEIEKMKSALRSEMAAGALGLSTGLEYDPGIYSTPEEVLELAKVAAESGGRYISHIRSEDRDLWQAVEEVVSIGRVTGMPVQVSHLKLGMADLWGQADRAIRLLDGARASGVQITADVYPYTYWSSNLGVFYPKRNFSDAAETAFILSHITPADEIIFSSGFPGHPEFNGKTLAQIAAGRGAPSAKTMMDLLAEPGGSGAGVVAKGMSDADVEALIRWPFANVCSDGASTGLHPRGFGSFAKVAGPYVRDKKLFSLEEAVRKMTTLSAANVGIVNRGRIAPGSFADLVLFDPDRIADRSTFESPQAQAVGVQTVWVNGQIVFDGAATTKRYPGRPLRREAAAAQRGTAPPPPAPPDPLVKENVTVKVADHTYVIPDGDVPLVPNVGIVVGSRATLVIDPGLGRRNGETVLREVARVSRNTELYIASTHFHAEHTTGYLAFPPTAKYVDSNVQEAEFAQGGAQQIAAFSNRSPATAALLAGATGRKADITFDREHVLDLGGVRVRMVVVGPTHTRGDTGMFVEGDGVLFAGDVVMNNSFLAATAATSMRAWLTAFDTFDAMRPRVVVPSHGAVGGAALIPANRALMQEIQTRVRELKARGQPVDDVVKSVQAELQAKHPEWPRANGIAAAARSAYTETN